VNSLLLSNHSRGTIPLVAQQKMNI